MEVRRRKPTREDELLIEVEIFGRHAGLTPFRTITYMHEKIVGEIQHLPDEEFNEQYGAANGFKRIFRKGV